MYYWAVLTMYLARNTWRTKTPFTFIVSGPLTGCSVVYMEKRYEENGYLLDVGFLMRWVVLRVSSDACYGRCRMDTFAY